MIEISLNVVILLIDKDMLKIGSIFILLNISFPTLFHILKLH